MIKVFISYSHKNEQQRERLGIHLAMLKRQGLVSEWHDRKLLAGQELVNEIDANLLDSQLVILLISSDFLASDYCYCQEMKKACELQGQGKIQIIPIIVDHCEWKQSPISSLLAIPQDGKPISEYSNPEKAYNEIAGAIRKVVESLSAVNGSSVIGDADIRSVRAEPIISDPVRSSNLTIKREFTDLDKNRFLKEGFDYIRKFFKNSLDELSSRNPGAEYDFEMPDNNSFIAHIYKGGTVAVQCLVSNNMNQRCWGNMITYSTSLERNSVIGGVQSKDNGVEQYFVPWIGALGDSHEMTFKGAAEYLWDQFIEPLQR